MHIVRPREAVSALIAISLWLALAPRAESVDVLVTYADKRQARIVDAHLVWDFGEDDAPPKPKALPKLVPVQRSLVNTFQLTWRPESGKPTPKPTRPISLAEIDRISFDYRVDGPGKLPSISWSLQSACRLRLRSGESFDVTAAYPIFDVPHRKAFVFSQRLMVCTRRPPDLLLGKPLEISFGDAEVKASPLFGAQTLGLDMREELGRTDRLEDVRRRVWEGYQAKVREATPRLVQEIVFVDPPPAPQ